MPRVYVRKHENFGKTPPEVMQKAVEDVLVRGKQVREAAKDNNVPRGTLRNNLKKAKALEHPAYEPNYTHARVFSDAQEGILASYALNCAKMFHGLTIKSFRCLTYEVAKANNMTYPSKWDEQQISGKEWYYGFMRRHPQLSIRQPEATSLARATAFNRHTINLYFDNLEKAIHDLSATGAQIFNLDETGITTVHKVPKVIGAKGTKQMGQITPGERGELVTMCCIVSAVGQAIPPVFVFPRKNYTDLMLNGAPEGSLGLVNPSGWMTAENFIHVINHVVKHVRPSQNYPIILTMDNHESHISYHSLEKAKENHITIVTLPPHTSNKTQPLDRTVFGPLKAAFSKTADAWMLQNPGKTIRIYQLAELGGAAFVKATTPSNIISGFRVSGTWPLDRNVFDNDEFMPSMVTDRPPPQSNGRSTDAVQEEQSSRSEAESSSSTKQTACEMQVITPGTSSECPQQQPTPSTSVSEPATMENPFAVSPVDLRGYPKAPARKESSRGRKRGKSMVATSTPEMKRLRQQQEEAFKRRERKKKATSAKKLCFELQDDDSASDISLNDLVNEVESDFEDVSDSETDVLKLDVVERVCVGDYVVVEYANKSSKCYYVGKVTKERDEEGDVEIDFLRKKGNYFVKPAVSDLCSVHVDNLRAVLSEPGVRGTTDRTKGELVFSVNFGQIDIR